MRHRLSAADDPAGWIHRLAHPSGADLRRGCAGAGNPVPRDGWVPGDEVRRRCRFHAAADRGSQHAQRGHDATRSVGVLRAAARYSEHGDPHRSASADGMSEHSVASGALGAASFSPRPVAAVALAAVAAAGATSIGTDLGGSLDSGGAGFAAAVAIAALALASVFVGAARGTHPSVVPVALLSAGAATIHLAAASSHFREWWAFGVFFVGSGVAQLVWALLTVRSPTPIVWWSGVLGNAAIIALWVLTRTVG